jgi:hypothetical protein
MTTRIRLDTLIGRYAPGSHDEAWTWSDEFHDLWDREPHPMRALTADLLAHGQTRPVTLGDDGRLWDGHHRTVALLTLAIFGQRTYIRIRSWDDMTDDEQYEALIEAAGDADDAARW